MVPGPADRTELLVLEDTVRALREALLAAETSQSTPIAATHPSHHRSARNLVHYLELRQHDFRSLQLELAALGLSSLGRSEANVLATIEAVLAVLVQLNGQTPQAPTAAIGLGEGDDILINNAGRILGPLPTGRSTRIMVTLPTEAADDPNLVTEFVAKGMDVARVNCAHDDADVWSRMIANIRTSGRSAGRPRIAMDLAGPKLRTGPLKPGPRVVKISPTRDKLGRVTAPARVWLTVNEDAAPEFPVVTGVTTLPVDDELWLQRRHVGERIEVSDSRGAQRHWQIVEVTSQGCSASCEKTTYLTAGLKLTGRKGDAVGIGELPAIEQAHRVDRGDRVILTRSLDPPQPTPTGSTHRIGCTLPEAFDHVRIGEHVWLDDGKIGATIERVTDDEIEMVVVDVRPGGANLRSGKGINLPDTDLQLDALTARDLEDLKFVAAHADVVNLSFVRSARDVERLQSELERLGASDIGIVLKIENVAAFENLPELLLTAMRSEKVGVMIARGDLAVEVGFERLAEVQEEIMWACEAAHVPVIWATQVLDTLARTGQPSRAEVTDAAMADRAECVMLNKGPYITNAIGALDSILTRMQHHQDKKRSLLRQLHAWDRSNTDHSA